MAQKGLKWLEMTPNSSKWVQITPNGSKWLKMALKKRLQMAGICLKWLQKFYTNPTKRPKGAKKVP